MNSIQISNLSRFVLWPRMRSILGNVPCELEKNVNSPVVGWSSLQMSIISSWLIVLLSFTMFLLISCPLNLFISESSVEILQYISGFTYFFVHFSLFLPYIFWHSIVRFIDVPILYSTLLPFVALTEHFKISFSVLSFLASVMLFFFFFLF